MNVFLFWEGEVAAFYKVFVENEEVPRPALYWVFSLFDFITASGYSKS